MNGIKHENNNEAVNEKDHIDVGVESKSIVPAVSVAEELHIKRKKGFIGKKQGGYIVYVRIYLLFFFVGACAFACGKWGYERISGFTACFLTADLKDFSDYCINFAPLVFGSFLIYASGFTIYASPLSMMYAAVVSSFCGASACSIVYLFGINVFTFSVLLLLGVSCIGCIILCTMSSGISKIASCGIGKLNLSDGVLFSVLYWGYIIIQYFLLKALQFCVLAA